MPSSKIYNANPYITKSIKYINDNIKKKLSIDEICQYINLSKFYFSRIFKEEVGVIFSKVLEDSGVFKRNKKGQAALEKFIKSVI